MGRAAAWTASLGLCLAALLGACSAPAPPTLAVCQDAAKSDADRMAACNAAIKANPAPSFLASAYRARGEVYGAVGDAARAAADETRAIGLDPSNDAAYQDRADDRLALGDLAGAKADYAEALRIRPSTGGYLRRSNAENDMGDHDGAIADAAKAIELSPENAAGWSAQGYGYLGKGAYAVALADFTSALKLNPDYIYAVLGKAEAYRDKGDPDAAIATCQAAIKGDTPNPRALDCRAQGYDAKADYPDALADYAAALAASPNAAWIYESRSGIYLDAGDGAKAIADANKALALAPKDGTALNNACWTRAVSRLELASALGFCQQSLALRPKADATLDSLGFTYFRLGDTAQALAAYNQALAIDAKLASSLFMRGVIRKHQGDAGGEADIAAALKLDAHIAKQYAAYGVTP